MFWSCNSPKELFHYDFKTEFQMKKMYILAQWGIACADGKRKKLNFLEKPDEVSISFLKI